MCVVCTNGVAIPKNKPLFEWLGGYNHCQTLYVCFITLKFIKKWIMFLKR